MSDGWGIAQENAYCIAAQVQEIHELREEIAKLHEALRQEREYHRQKSYPEPFRIGAVYAQRDGIRYMLPIIGQWNEYPDIAIEVGWDGFTVPKQGVKND